MFGEAKVWDLPSFCVLNHTCAFFNVIIPKFRTSRCGPKFATSQPQDFGFKLSGCDHNNVVLFYLQLLRHQDDEMLDQCLSEL